MPVDARLPIKPFGEMTAEEYRAIGFKCGLEVHQQLLTRSKLFCRCPAGHYSSDFDAEVLRHMRPTLSEMGEYDGTALMEKKTRKNITYRIHRATVCTYEFDDTPPFPIDPTAVDIALELALLLRLNLVNELHIARKQYLDGSIPTGFQRTTILGVDGWIPYKDRRIGVRQLGLEEDSCREVSDRGHDRVYLTDRLGTPLIEVVTEPDMRTPAEAAEVCRVIGRLCRCTQKVRRGYGATRQDVNVSVSGGTRIEIKGVPQIWRIPHLVHNEAGRQVALLRIREELHSRGVTEKTLQTDSQDVTDLLARTSYAPLRSALDAGKRAYCVRLAGFGGSLATLTQEHTTFAKEFSDRIRVIACLTDLPNMVHSDTASDSLWPQDWQKLRKRMRATDRDALIVLWGDQRDTKTGCEEVVNRAREATIGVPSDTRQPYKDGTNGFERVLPGPERMYPDTDLPPLAIGADRVERVRGGMAEPVWDTEKRFRDAGMVADDADRLAISPRVPLIRRAIEELGVPGVLVGVLMRQRMAAWARAGLAPSRLGDDAIVEVLSAHTSGRLAREGIFHVLEHLLEGGRDGAANTAQDVRTSLDELGLRPIDDGALRRDIAAAIAATDGARFAIREALERHLMGLIMGDLVGRAPGSHVLELLREELEAPRGALAATAKGPRR